MVKPRLGLIQGHLAVKLGLPNPCLRPAFPSGPCVGASLSQHMGGSTLGCSPGSHVCCNQDAIDAGLELGQSSKAFFLCQMRKRIGEMELSVR